MPNSFYCLFVVTIFFLCGFAIAKRPGKNQDCWPQIRILAKTRNTFRAIGCTDAVAIFLTEMLSGVLHAMAAWGASDLIGPLRSWAPHIGGYVFVFWLGLGMGQAIAAEHRALAMKAASTAVEDFLQNPIPCLLPHIQATSSAWSEDDCDDLYVRSNGVSIAYVHNINVDSKTRVVTIGHFAVAKGFERNGIGRRLAHVLRSELAWRFKTTEIRFEENSRRYFDAGYGAFFQSLGAIPVMDPQKSRPDWLWKV